MSMSVKIFLASSFVPRIIISYSLTHKKMTDRELFIEVLKKEIKIFEKVLKEVEKVPKSKHTYKHDEKSRTTWQLVESTMGSESGMFPVILKTGKIDFATWPKAKWKTIEEVRKEFTKNMNATVKLAEKMTTKDWNAKAGMYMGGKTETSWQSTKGKMVWEFLLDLIHHRGQLSTHLRPMGGKVPQIYGPSADYPM